MGQARSESLSEAVAEIAEARGPREQIRGMLMLVYRISADAAFDLLRWRSQETNVKLRPLAEQIGTDFLALQYDEVLPPQVRVRPPVADRTSAARTLTFITAR